MRFVCPTRALKEPSKSQNIMLLSLEPLANIVGDKTFKAFTLLVCPVNLNRKLCVLRFHTIILLSLLALANNVSFIFFKSYTILLWPLRVKSNNPELVKLNTLILPLYRPEASKLFASKFIE